MTLWSGRFAEPPSDVLWRYTVDHSDHRLLVDDVTGSLAHVAMLGEAGILPDEDTAALTDGLRRILGEAESGEFRFVDGDEDVHSAVERRLIELVGEVGGKLHTGRSRNDQVALDLRLYLRRAAEARADQLAAFALMLADLAEGTADLVVPVFTHLQQAQPISFGHHLLAHAWPMLRDRERIIECMARLDVSPLGAGAAGGSSLPIRPDAVAGELGMSAIFENSIDAVAGRDVVCEYVFCCAQTVVGLSRLAEELVLWGTSEFGWVTYDERTVTGSSALPQKQNPDIAELARGRAATVLGDVTALLALQKGLPLAYRARPAGGQGSRLPRRRHAGSDARGTGRHARRGPVSPTAPVERDSCARPGGTAHRARRAISPCPPGGGPSGGGPPWGRPRPRFGNRR